MHEFSIAQMLIETAEREARQAGASRILKVTCRIGPLRQIEEWFLLQAFELARAGTMCEEAQLELTKAPIFMRCRDCRHEYSSLQLDWTCPQCGALSEHVRGGDELDLMTLEAETEEDSVREA